MSAKKTEVPETILAIVVGLVVFYFLKKSVYFLYAALVIGVIGLFSAYLSNLVHIAWTKLAKVLSYIVPSILFSLVFYLVVFPISLFSKVFKNNSYLLIKNNHTTTFKDASGDFKKQNFEKLW